MKALDETLSNGNGTIFQTTTAGDVYLHLNGTFNSAITARVGVVTPPVDVFAPDGTAFSAAASSTYRFNLPPGMYFRLVSSDASDDVDSWVEGPVRIST